MERIKAAKVANDDGALERALIDLGSALESTAARRLATRFAELNANGYLKTLDDAEDALSVVGWRIYSKIESYRGATDAEANAWVRRVVDNAFRDVVRKFFRRRDVWNAFFRAIPARLKRFLETDDSNDD